MKTKMNKNATEDRKPDEGDWLYAILTDVHEELANQPRPQAIQRIRDRIDEALSPSERAAA